MITRSMPDTEGRKDVWSELAATLPEDVKAWRQDGRPVQRDGKFFARFVVYIEANTVRERLDATVPGEWDLTLELLPPLATMENDEPGCSFKARLQILGVIREDVGTGRDYKQAATDAFKRAAVRFGIAHELYAYEQNWVQVDGDGKFAKPVEDLADAYARRQARNGGSAPARPTSARAASTVADTTGGADSPTMNSTPTSNGNTTPEPSVSSQSSPDDPSCPKCSGRMWDNRLTRRNPKAPLYKCRSRSCDGVIWPPRAERCAAERPDDHRRNAV